MNTLSAIYVLPGGFYFILVMQVMLFGSTGVRFKGILLYQYVFHGLGKLRLPATTYSMQRAVGLKTREG
jgi:hypothetical protein